MTISFNDVLEKTRDCLSHEGHPDPMMETLDGITIIRDVVGRVRLFLELKDGATASPAALEGLRERMRTSLGAYCAEGDVIWLANASRDAFFALDKQVIEQRESAPWDDNNTLPRWYVLERHVAKQVWTSRSASSPPWSTSLAMQGHKPAILTFFSFKGGAGRSSTLAATALTLARRGHRVAMVDLDLEAPGLASLFLPDTSQLTGVVDYLLEKPIQGSEWKLHAQVLTIGDPTLVGDRGEALRLLPAGSVNSHYLEKLARLDFQHLVHKALAETLKEMLRELERIYRPLDFIFLDARAGFHDIGGVATMALSHAAVLFGAHTGQTWAGLTQVISRLAQVHPTEPLPALLVHAMAPPLSTPGRDRELALFRTKAYDVFRVNYYSESELPPNENDRDGPFMPVVIPWQDSLRGDLALYSEGSSQDEANRLSDVVGVLTGKAYVDLAERMCRLFGRRLVRSQGA